MRPVLPLLLTLFTPALAKTPDGVTPSEETVCDVYSGGAYGLCNAYCEAMDCDDPNTRASDKACERVAASFARKTGGDGLPCEATEECTVTAVNEFVELSAPGPFSVDVLANDEATPDGATLEIDSDTAPSDLTEEDGEFSGVWPSDVSYYYESFEYTVCCDEDTCDTAEVTILGS